MTALAQCFWGKGRCGWQAHGRRKQTIQEISPDFHVWQSDQEGYHLPLWGCGAPADMLIVEG